MKTQKLKAWIAIHSKASKRHTPDVYWSKLTKLELDNFKEFGYDVYPCTVTYSLPTVTKSKKTKKI